MHLTLHPDTRWHSRDSSDLVVMGPKGAELTFAGFSVLGIQVLQCLARPMEPADLLEKFGPDREVVDDFVSELIHADCVLRVDGATVEEDRYLQLMRIEDGSQRPWPVASTATTAAVHLSGDPRLTGFVQAAARGLNVPIAQAASEAQISVVCGFDGNHELFRKENRAAVAAGRTLSFIRVDFPRVRVGPIVFPGATACYECMYARIRSRAGTQNDGGDSALRPPGLHLLNLMACQHLTALSRNAFGVTVPGTVYSLSALDLSASREFVSKAPRCAVCSRTNASAFAAAIRDVWAGRKW